MSYTKLPAVKGSAACLTCGCGAHETFAMNDIVAVGFGSAMLLKDGEVIFDEQTEEHAAEREKRDARIWTGQDCEDAAAKDPNHDWRIQKNAPLYDAEYRRQGAGHWVLVSKGMGFA